MWFSFFRAYILKLLSSKQHVFIYPSIIIHQCTLKRLLVRFVMWKDILHANPFSTKPDKLSPRKGFSGTTMKVEFCGTNYLDTSRAAFTHCVRHSGTRRINHGDETQEAELLGGKVHVVAVEGETSGELGWRQIQVAEACKRGGINEVIVHKWLKRVDSSD